MEIVAETGASYFTTGVGAAAGATSLSFFFSETAILRKVSTGVKSQRNCARRECGAHKEAPLHLETHRRKRVSGNWRTHLGGGKPPETNHG